MQNSPLKNVYMTESARISPAYDTLRYLAFENSLQANIISAVSSGKIIVANRAACKLLGYGRKKLLTKNRACIFDINERSFKKMLKQRTEGGHSTALVTAIRKNGKLFRCEITSAVFMDDGIEKSVTTITDMSRRIRKQKNIDTKQKKIVTDNIRHAKSKQKKTDISKEKTVVNNILIAKSKQQKIDSDKERIVAENIILAQAKSDARQEENANWKKNIGTKLYDVMWDWNIATGEIFAGDSLEEVFG